MRPGIRRFVLPLFTAALAVLPLAAATAGGIHIHNPYIPEAPPTAGAVAGYMELMNHGDRDRLLVGASSPDFANSMVHDIAHDGGMARMIHLNELKVPAGQTVSFAPGGLHLMLVGPQRKLTKGEEVEVTLIFQDGGRTTATFPVVGADTGRGGDHGHHHHHH